MQNLKEIKTGNKIFKPKVNKKVKNTEKSVDSDLPTDDSIVDDDDVENDPDWTQTPLYNRIQKLLVIN